MKQQTNIPKPRCWRGDGVELDHETMQPLKQQDNKVNQYKIIPHVVCSCVFPDNGPEQGDTARWVEANGGELSLYDGATENNVKTSTDAVWRWKYGMINTGGATKLVNIGDYIVKMPTGLFEVYSPDIFMALFED